MPDSPSRGGGAGSQGRHNKGHDRGAEGGSTTTAAGISFMAEFGRRCGRRPKCWRRGGGLASGHDSRGGGGLGRRGEVAWEAAAAASRLTSEDSDDEKRGVEEPGKHSRPHVSWISSPWKTQGSGLQFLAPRASKGCARLPQGSLPRGFHTPGNHGDPGGEMRFQTSP